jgi:hypothetical protein
VTPSPIQRFSSRVFVSPPMRCARGRTGSKACGTFPFAQLAVEWPGQLVPTPSYDAVERNRAFRRVVGRVAKQAVSMVAQLWERAKGDPSDALRKLAILAFSTHPAFADQAGLALAPILRTTDERWVCATELAELNRPIRAVSSSSHEGAWKAVDDLPVLVLDEDDRATAHVLDAAQVNVVPYERGSSVCAGTTPPGRCWNGRARIPTFKLP